MSDTDDSNRAIQALRERHAEISNDIALLAAQGEEVLRAIGIVERNGRKKPGPKPAQSTPGWCPSFGTCDRGCLQGPSKTQMSRCARAIEIAKELRDPMAPVPESATRLATAELASVAADAEHEP